MDTRLDGRVAAMADRLEGRFALWAGALSPAVSEALERAGRDRLLARLFSADPSLWSTDPAVQERIANRLGWLTSPEWMVPRLDRVRAFAEGIRSDGFAHVVLLGMGGSSLAPEVLRAVVGPRDGWMAFHMLDSTDPASVAAVDAGIDLPRTLFLLASKSGGTIEPNSMAAHFRHRLEQAGLPWARQFVAITDEGTALHRRATEEGFREIFVNPADIGGRYSAMSFFGLVPAALMGLDVAAVVDWARAMLYVCGPDRPAGTNPALLLGLAMGIGAARGRDKLTLVGEARLDAFGLWAEQLVAESTGKSGRGVVPVAGEPLGPGAEYGTDRLFVHLGLGQGDRAGVEQVRTLAADGHPFIQIDLPEAEALGGEFVRWELATAVAGAVLGVNPFDEPNVQQAKDATRRLLDAYASSGSLPIPAKSGTLAGMDVSLTAAARTALGTTDPSRFLSLVGQGDYVGILAYLGPAPELTAPLLSLRTAIRASTQAATTFGYGPRYLHSTGQLHKGGANNGVFLIVSVAPAADLDVPGAGMSFGTLELAQARGDFASLDAADRRALYLHLPEPDPLWVQRACNALLAALHKPGVP